eukprot:TRINITY_DN1398_c0_g1_i4.p1 TRINITY_DN1398_c0_g1~~TRINITY_DN1398_c0_g1_i4.p1  ORF type:complete len:372 (-),score=75.60 TRINITY_DN1398_c0_g1_i4:57-1172(-)
MFFPFSTERRRRHMADESSWTEGKETPAFSLRVDLQKKHRGSVYNVRFSPCGRFLASCSQDQTVFLWNLSQGTDVCVLKGHMMHVLDVGWSGDGMTLCSGGFDRSVRLWDVKESREIQTYRVDGMIQSVAMSETDGCYAYACDVKGHIWGFDVRAKDPIMSIENDVAVNTIALLPDSKMTLFSGDRNGCIKQWDIRKLVAMDNIVSKPAPISHLSFIQPSLKRWLLCANSYDNALWIYGRRGDLVTSEESTKFSHQFSAKGGHLSRNWPIRSAMFCGKEVKWFMFPDEREREKRLDHERDRSSIDTSVFAATGSTDANIYVYSLQEVDGHQCRVHQILEGHTGKVFSVDFHPEKPILASASEDQTIKIWMP